MRCFSLMGTAIALLIAFLVAPARVLAQAETPAVDESRHIYLLIGQSNMAGRAPFTEDEAGVIERCFLLNAEDQWEPATNPLNRYSTIRKGLGMQKLNPGYSFAKAMLQKDQGITLGLVVNAKGGSGSKEWSKGTKSYDDAVRRTKAAQKSGKLKGILWHQGESDEKDADYLAKVKALIADLRKDLGDPLLPFVCGQIKEVPLINDQLMALPVSVPFTACASADGLKTMDRWHFDAPSVKLLGERYASLMHSLISDQKKP